MEQHTEDSAYALTNEQLLSQLTAFQSLVAAGLGNSIVRINLNILTEEKRLRVQWGTLVEAPVAPVQPVYAPQATQVKELRKRLGQLQLTAARYGINTPPEVNIEIEDILKSLA